MVRFLRLGKFVFKVAFADITGSDYVSADKLATGNLENVGLVA